MQWLARASRLRHPPRCNRQGRKVRRRLARLTWVDHFVRGVMPRLRRVPPLRGSP